MSPPRYRIVVEGELGPRYASAFDGMTLRAHDGETAITGPIIDHSHLQGLIARIASLGLTLRSLTPLETENAQSNAQPHTQPAGIEHHNPGAHSEGPLLAVVTSRLGASARNVPQGALLLSDRFLPAVPVDHRRTNRTHAGGRRQGVGQTPATGDI